jgi:hypothetical protein
VLGLEIPVTSMSSRVASHWRDTLRSCSSHAGVTPIVDDGRSVLTSNNWRIPWRLARYLRRSPAPGCSRSVRLIVTLFVRPRTVTFQTLTGLAQRKGPGDGLESGDLTVTSDGAPLVASPARLASHVFEAEGT